MRVLLIPGLLLAISPHLYAGDVLTARFADNLSVVDAELCFDGAAPDRIYRNNQASNWSQNILHNSQPVKVRENDGTVRLPSLPDNSCLNWQVNFNNALAPHKGQVVMKVGGDLIMNADVWFWRGARNRGLSVHMMLPEGISFSTPWRLTGYEDRISIYQPDNTPPSWEAKIALGSFPQPKVQVLIIPNGKLGRYGTFGQVLRGGGLATIFYINENSSLQEFRNQWTATHEFSHMLLPYISSRDRWLSEGLASYYQNVLRARDGRLSATQAWQELYGGFERGRKATTGGTLAQATRAGRAATMRVYWSGAAIMLMADVQLRQASNGQQSLDSALASLDECCLSNSETWRAKVMFEKLDALTDSRVFSDLYQKYVNSEDFPDLQETWNALGIDINNNQLNLKEDAPLLTPRTAIMKD